MALKGREEFTLLEDILKLKRPAGGCTEREAINKFIKPTGAVEDRYGNYHIKVGGTPIVWSCHTDTVHNKSGTQSIIYGEKDGCIYLDETIKKAECLGADDGAGMWLMIKMIEAGVPGHYVFHREEEVGGGGSKFCNTDPTWTAYFKEHKAVIALDRRGFNDVITHQGTRTCSDEFAQELADQLHSLMYPNGLDLSDASVKKHYLWRPKRGVWTDSANYTDNVGECTNLSVGYFNQHSMYECQDPDFLQELLVCLTNLDTDKLLAACTRKAGEKEVVVSYYSGHGTSSRAMVPSDGGILFDDPLYDDAMSNEYMVEDDDMAEVIERYPDEVAELLRAWGYTKDKLIDEIDYASGCINK